MRWNSLLCASVFSGIGVFSLVFGFILFPIILKSQLRKEMALSKKTDVRKMWEKLPFAMDYKIYLFNYTNPEEVQKGGIPIVKEVGPYYFAEWREKVDIEDHEANDTVSYKRLDTFYFRPDLSGSTLTGEEIITMPHIFMLGVAISTARTQPKMLNIVGKALEGIFNKPSDLFMRVKALDILFRGINIDCAKTEMAPKAVCSHFRKEGARGLVPGPNNQFKFSLFGSNNNTVDSKVITVKRGKKNVKLVGNVVAINGESEQKIWHDTCNHFVGTDGTVFPPFMKTIDPVMSFSIDLCRPFKLWFQKKTKYENIKTNRYVTNIGDLSNNPELQCFCEAPDKCPPKGLMDVNNCMQAPLYVSLPHFLDSDPIFQEQVKGLKPDLNEHGIEIDFEPITGTPMMAKQRVQFNIQLINLMKLNLFKDLSDNIVPLFWIEESLALNKTYVNMLNRQLFIPKNIVHIIRLALPILGVIWTIICIGFHYRDNIIEFIITDNKVSTKVNPMEKEEPKKDINMISEA